MVAKRCFLTTVCKPMLYNECGHRPGHGVFGVRKSPCTGAMNKIDPE
jgi:hypothetical protein